MVSHAAMFGRHSSQKFHKETLRAVKLLLTCLMSNSMRSCVYALQERAGVCHLIGGYIEMNSMI